MPGTAAKRMVDAGVDAFMQALDRYQAVHDDGGNDEAQHFVPLAEALWWAQAVDEVLGKQHDEPYRRAPGRDADLIHGLRYARNRVGHNLAMALSWQDGRMLPMQLPAPLSEFRWRLFAELPAPDPKRPD